jgi:ankyrin repeat protein
MERKITLQELIQKAGVAQDVTRQPCLPAPTETAVLASEDDHAQARTILQDRRAKNPEHKDVLKRIFRSKDKKDSQEVAQYSQEELDQALSAVLRGPTTSPGLTQAYLDLGAKVNFIDTPEKKRRASNQPNTGLRRRTTVLQQAAALRRPTCVSLLAGAGADQTSLDEGLKAALTSNDQESVKELLRYGADLNNFPNALANAVRSNDQNFVRTLLRAPKAIQPKIISSCLPAAVQQGSDKIVALLVAYDADPNFDSASALNTAIGMQDYRMAATIVTSPVPLTKATLQRLLDTSLRLPTCEAQLQFLQLLFCCGLNPNSIGLPDLLICRVKKNDTAGVLMMLSYGVSTATNDAECLRVAISNSNWRLVEAVLQTPIPPQQASAALTFLPPTTPQSERLQVIQLLVQRGATGQPLEYWLTRSVEDGDTSLINLLLSAGAPVASSNRSPVFAAIARKDVQSLKSLLNTRPPPEVLAKAFKLLRTGYSVSERLAVSRLLLISGARGSEVNQALVDAIADTSSSRDVALITELVRHGASVDYDNGKVLQLAVTQVDLSLLRLLCGSKPSPSSASAALPLAFDSKGNRHSQTAEIIELLLAHGVEEDPARRTVQIAISGGPENVDIIQQLIAANIRLLSSAFEYAVTIEDPRKKSLILDVLLKMGVGQEALDQALAAETRHAVSNKDTTSIKMLVEKGASVSHNNGEALSIAVASGDNLLTEVLLSGKRRPSLSSVTRAFRALFVNESSTFEDAQVHPRAEGYEDCVLKIARSLLSRGVEQTAIDFALHVEVSHAHGSRIHEPLVDLLLQYNANVNTADGSCFVVAAHRHHLTVFEKLMAQKPEFGTIVPALLSSKLHDDIVVASIKSCFAHGCTSDELEVGPLRSHTAPVLIVAMQQYPRNDALATVLLGQGCNPDISLRDVVDPSAGEEDVTPLLWALNQPQKRISDSIITTLVNAGASAISASSSSEIVPIILAAREGRSNGIVQQLLERGADASARDHTNRSALFYASSTSSFSAVKALAPYALKNDGSLHEAARCAQLDIVAILIEHGHNPNFPSRLHHGRHALGELCLNAHITTSSQRSKVRRIIRLCLDNNADPKFKARNEKSAVILALDNAYSALEITDALLETEIWQDLNDENHMYRDAKTGLWYSPLSYIELIPSPTRAPHKQSLIDLLRDKGCKPAFYSETAVQPPGAIGIPPPVQRLVDRQKEHELTLRHEQERHEHARSLEETTHRDALRRKREQQDHDLAARTQAHAHHQSLEQQTHDASIHRVRDAERMKRGEMVARHNLVMEQEHDASARRQALKDRETSSAAVAENRMIEQRKGELEHRANVERRMLKDKEDVYERNVKRQTEVMKRTDESAALHARLRQDRPAIEGAPQWGSVD